MVQGSLRLSNIEDLEDLVSELDLQFNRNQIHRLSDGEETSWDTVKNAIFQDYRHVTYNNDDLPSSWEFKADGSIGAVNLRWSDFQLSAIVIDYPADTRFAEFQLNWQSSSPWLISDIQKTLYTN